MQAGLVYPCRTVSTRDFTEGLAQNETATVSLQLPDAIGGSRSARALIRQVAIFSVQQLAWDLFVFSTAGFDLSPIDLVDPRARVRFAATDGILIGGGPLYCYFRETAIPYEDFDPTYGRLHLLLQNRSPDAKAAGAAGAIVVRLLMEPTYA